MVVVKKTRNEAYRLAELDGALSRLRFAAFRLVPYHTRSRSIISVVRPARVLSPKLRSCYLDLDLCHLDARTLICSLVVFLVLPFCI